MIEALGQLAVFYILTAEDEKLNGDVDLTPYILPLAMGYAATGFANLATSLLSKLSRNIRHPWQFSKAPLPWTERKPPWPRRSNWPLTISGTMPRENSSSPFKPPCPKSQPAAVPPVPTPSPKPASKDLLPKFLTSRAQGALPHHHFPPLKRNFPQREISYLLGKPELQLDIRCGRHRKFTSPHGEARIRAAPCWPPTFTGQDIALALEMPIYSQPNPPDIARKEGTCSSTGENNWGFAWAFDHASSIMRDGNRPI